MRHLPGPQEDSWDEKWTAKLQAVNESLPFGPLPARPVKAVKEAAGRVTSLRRLHFLAGLSKRVA